VTAELLRFPADPTAAPATPVDCRERFRLRAEHIQRLADFNAAAARHRMVAQVGMHGAAADASWRNVQEAGAASNAAWARYRAHLAAHGCRRARFEMKPAA
jgi:hypothetical protein